MCDEHLQLTADEKLSCEIVIMLVNEDINLTSGPVLYPELKGWQFKVLRLIHRRLQSESFAV